MTDATTTTDPAADLTYRLLRDDELDGIVRLYDLAGWGPADASWFERWFFRGRLGPAVVAVAVNAEDELLGMMTFTPVEVQLFQRTAVACRGRATVLDARIRRSARGVTGDLDELDPVRRLSAAARPHIVERGWELHFALPNVRMLSRGGS